MDQYNESSSVSVFYVYASEDEELLIQLEKHMSPLRRKGMVVEWSQRNLDPGADKEQTIKQQLRAAHIVLLLISADFLASESCMSEAQEALHKKKIVWPILLSPVDWSHTPFAHLQCLPFNRLPIVMWENQNAAFQEIVEKMYLTIERLRFTRETITLPLAKTTPEDEISPSSQITSATTSTRLLYKYDLHSSIPLSVTWSPNGKHIASCGVDKTVRIWHAATGQHVLTYREHSNLIPFAAVWIVRWSPDGTRIASAGTDTNMLIWNATNGQTITSYTQNIPLLLNIFTLRWSSDNTRIAFTYNTAIDAGVHIWDTNNGRILKKLRFHKIPLSSTVTSMDWSSDETRIVACWGKYIQLSHVSSGKRILSYNEHSDFIYRVAWSPTMHTIASTAAREVHIWDATTGKTLQRYTDHNGTIRDLAWSPNGKYVATASEDHTVHIWEAATGKRQYVYTGHHDIVRAVTWSPDGTRIASASHDKTIHVWRTMLDA